VPGNAPAEAFTPWDRNALKQRYDNALKQRYDDVFD